MITNKTDEILKELDSIYENTLKSLKKKYGEQLCKLEQFKFEYEFAFALIKSFIFIDFIENLYTERNFNITTDDIKEHLDLDPRYITLKFNDFIDYTRYPEGAYLYFDSRYDLSLVEKEKLKRKIVFYSQDSYKKFLKENIFLVNETKKLDIDINKLIINNELKDNIDIDKLIISEIKAIKKTYYENANIKKNVINIDNNTIKKILDKEMNFLTTGTVKQFVKNDILERQKDKLLNTLNFKKNTGRISIKQFELELIEITKNYNINTTNIYDYKNIYNEAYDQQLERFLYSLTYKEYNLYIKENTTPIRLFSFEREEDKELEEDTKYTIDKAAWYQGIEKDIIENVQKKIDRQNIRYKKEIATNQRAKEEIQFRKALSDIDVKENLLKNTNSNYRKYIINAINKFSEEDE